MLHAYPVPAAMPVKIPVPLVTLLNVYDNGDVPPAPVSVTVAISPLQRMAEVTEAEPVTAAGSVTSRVPVTGPQLLASVILHDILFRLLCL